MKLSKKINIILACIALIFSLIIIQDTYAKYLTAATGGANISIARWRILVNDQDIRNNSDITQTITPKFIENEHISSDIIAPLSEGYFDLIIDHTSADVSFEYEIATTVNETSSVQDIITTGYSINGGEITELTEENKIIKNTVPLSNEEKIITIRIYIKWDDSENATMDNEQDTQATLSDTPAKLDVNLSFKQITGNNQNQEGNQTPNE